MKARFSTTRCKWLHNAAFRLWGLLCERVALWLWIRGQPGGVLAQPIFCLFELDRIAIFIKVGAIAKGYWR